jgi:hypothetical protein
MTIELPRRGFILGLASLIAAPAVVMAASLMHVKAPKFGSILRIRLPNDYVIRDTVRLDVLYGKLNISPNWNLNLNGLHTRP